MDRQNDFTGGDPRLYLGELRGYRYWDMSDDGTLHPVSMARRSIEWVSPFTATCSLAGKPCYAPFGLPMEVTTPEVEVFAKALESHWVHSPGAPDKRCLCGIYAWYDPHEAASNHINRKLAIPGTPRQVLGVIAASGLIIPGSKGFKAGRARIEALVLPDGFDLIEWLLYGVKISTARQRCRQIYKDAVVLGDADELIEAFPPEEVEWREAA